MTVRLESDVLLRSIAGRSVAYDMFCFHVQKEPYGKCMVEVPSLCLTHNVYVEMDANVKYTEMYQDTLKQKNCE